MVAYLGIFSFGGSNIAELNGMTHPEFRGRGYGKLALKKVLQSIFKKNIYDIELDVECKNSITLNLYKSCGFEEMSVIKYYEIKLIES